MCHSFLFSITQIKGKTLRRQDRGNKRDGARDRRIGGIESLLEGLIWELSGDQMGRDKPSEHIQEPGN